MQDERWETKRGCSSARATHFFGNPRWPCFKCPWGRSHYQAWVPLSATARTGGPANHTGGLCCLVARGGGAQEWHPLKFPHPHTQRQASRATHSKKKNKQEQPRFYAVMVGQDYFLASFAFSETILSCVFFSGCMCVVCSND